MQISTIDVRTEGVDRPSGGKKGGKDEASAESAFAAFFATQLGAQRKPETKTAGNDEADTVSEVESTKDANATPKTETKAEQNVEAESTTNTEVATPSAGKTQTSELSGGGEQTEAAAIAVLQPKRAASTAKFSVRAKDGTAAIVKLNVSAAQPAINENAEAGATDVAPVASAPPTVPLPSSEAAAIISRQASIKTEPAFTQVNPELIVTPPSAAKTDAAGVIEGPANSEAIEAPVDAPIAATSNAGEQPGQDPSNNAERLLPDHAAKSPVSKLQSHAVSTEATPVQAAKESVNGEPKVSQPHATDLAESVEALPQDDVASNVLESIAAKPEMHKTDAQVVRNVTQVVSQDGAVLATRTTEVRSEHAQASTQREVVVIEKTTAQALPEQALRGARFLLNNAEQTIRIRLMPESLGEVRLEVVAAKGDVTVKLASANAAVREILQTHAPGLQHAIAQDNAGNVRVTVTADIGSSAWLSSNAQRNTGQQDPNAQAQANHRSAAPSLYRNANPTTPETPRREAAHAGNLNVYV